MRGMNPHANYITRKNTGMNPRVNISYTFITGASPRVKIYLPYGWDDCGAIFKVPLFTSILLMRVTFLSTMAKSPKSPNADAA